jgi:biofilm PGA synthesis protein PgaD
MNKSKNESTLIIDRPDLVAPGQKFTAWGITLLFWGALLYLWQPLLSMLAWGLNIRLFYNHMILLGGYRTFLDLLAMYLAIIAVLGGGLVLWARINQWRFRGKERRTGIGATNVESLSKNFGLGIEDIHRIAQHKIIAVTFINDDKISVAVPGAVSDLFTELPRQN